MEKFESYDGMLKWMTTRGRKSKYSSLVQYIEIEVEREAAVLLRRAVLSSTRTQEELEDECRQDAKEHYLEEINEYLDSDVPPPPLDHRVLMAYRRKPVAWAIASEIFRLESE